MSDNDFLLNYNSAAALHNFLEQEGLGMRKKFGQNFLINPQIRKSLIDALGANNDSCVWEIGPGLGAMTSLLLEKGSNVLAFEIDEGFNRVLKRLFSYKKNFHLVEGDVMKTWRRFGNAEIQPANDEKAHDKFTQSEILKNKELYLIGNLPYNIAAALLADFVENGMFFSRIVVTVQKEAAVRMAAKAGTGDYSSFSVLCASAYNIKKLMTIRPSSFYPQPNVDSMGVLLERIKPEKREDGISSIFHPLVRALFVSRRKTIKNNLTLFLSNRLSQVISKKGQIFKLPINVSAQEFCSDILQKNRIKENERAENLEPDILISLAKSIENMLI